ncbi:MAG TPA: winged helix-turn-helix domain-containing protein [Candidatus Solibacter sp.]|nr:winged helix-turn-helix domain-containing protein [Candidatus Solibacter sp.]
MDGLSKTVFRVGNWRVNPPAGEISRGAETVRLETRTMGLLLCLAEHRGEVVSIDDLLTHVWPDVTVSPDSVYQAVASLRKQLGDDPKQPTHIVTVPRLGYRMVAQVAPWAEATPQSAQLSMRKHRALVGWFGSTALILLSALLVVPYVLRQRGASGRTSAVIAAQPQKSVAVLPFLDLTEGMKEEEFADGMTEELIGRLSKIPDFRVPSPTTSFFYEDKKVPLAEIAKALGVAYVLDGSVRKSSTRFRVAARLVRPENGFVIWSETYDRPLGDRLWVQEDIANEAVKALRASIEAAPK